MRYLLAIPVVLLLLLLGVLTTGGCSSRGYARAIGVLPAQRGDLKMSPYQPANPLLPVADGVVARTLHQAPAGAGYRVDTQELIVGPGPRKATLSLKSAGVFEITSGAGTIALGEKRQEISSGSTLAIPEGQPLTIENTGAGSITIRAHLFVAE